MSTFVYTEGVKNRKNPVYYVVCVRPPKERCKKYQNSDKNRTTICYDLLHNIFISIINFDTFFAPHFMYLAIFDFFVL